MEMFVLFVDCMLTAPLGLNIISNVFHLGSLRRLNLGLRTLTKLRVAEVCGQRAGRLRIRGGIQFRARAHRSARPFAIVHRRRSSRAELEAQLVRLVQVCEEVDAGPASGEYLADVRADEVLRDSVLVSGVAIRGVGGSIVIGVKAQIPGLTALEVTWLSRMVW